MESSQSVARKRKPNGHAARAATGAPPELDLGEFLDALQAMQAGDFSVRLPGSKTGVAGKIFDTFNTIVAANQRIAQQLERVGDVVGRALKGEFLRSANIVNTMITQRSVFTSEDARTAAQLR